MSDRAADSLRQLSFIAEWYHEEAEIMRNFLLTFHKTDNAVEIFDQRTKKTFLRRTRLNGITEKDFFVGSRIDMFGRQFHIIDYGNEQTQKNLAKMRKPAFIIIKNTIIKYLGELLSALIDCDFSVSRGLLGEFTAQNINAFLNQGNKERDIETSVLMKQLLSGPCIGLEIVGDNAVEKMKYYLKQDQDTAQQNHIETNKNLLMFFSSAEMRNGIYCSLNDDMVQCDGKFFFENLKAPLELNNTTLAIIKPHAIKERNLGRIISEILANGFKITSLKIHCMEKANCEEFYEVYKSVVPEYIPMVLQLASGFSMALAIECNDPSKCSHEEFRKFCGPTDPEIAKFLRPNTLRAKYGTSKTLNAVHCTDLLDDCELEIQYIFKILA